jgi:hypothetical protein
VNDAPDRCRGGPARPDRRQAGNRNAILAREAERARRALTEHPEGTANRLRGFLT